jgi:hypothetical protein
VGDKIARKLVVLALFALAGAANGANVSHQNLTEKYSSLFPKYLRPQVTLEPIGAAPILPALQLVRVHNYPPPPADP